MIRKQNGVTGLFSCPSCGDDDIAAIRRVVDGAGIVQCNLCGKGILRKLEDGGLVQAKIEWQELNGYWEGCSQD